MPVSTRISLSPTPDIFFAIRALVKLNVSKNSLKGKEAGKAFASALAANTTLKELDLSGGKDQYGNDLGIDLAFAKEFAVGLSANGALASLDLSQNLIPAKGMDPIERLCESKQIALRK